MFKEAQIQCPFCYKDQTAFLDPEEADNATIIVDCVNCCHPMELDITWDEDHTEATARATKGGGF